MNRLQSCLFWLNLSCWLRQVRWTDCFSILVEVCIWWNSVWSLCLWLTISSPLIYSINIAYQMLSEAFGCSKHKLIVCSNGPCILMGATWAGVYPSNIFGEERRKREGCILVIRGNIFTGVSDWNLKGVRSRETEKWGQFFQTEARVCLVSLKGIKVMAHGAKSMTGDETTNGIRTKGPWEDHK